MGPWPAKSSPNVHVRAGWVAPTGGVHHIYLLYFVRPVDGGVRGRFSFPPRIGGLGSRVLIAGGIVMGVQFSHFKTICKWTTIISKQPIWGVLPVIGIWGLGFPGFGGGACGCAPVWGWIRYSNTCLLIV